MLTELLAHGNDRVVRAMSGALRNLAIDVRNKDLLGESLKVWGVDGEAESGGVTLYVCVPRETRGASSGGQPAWRGSEPASASALGGDGGICSQHTPGGPGFGSGGSQDSQGLAGHREIGADQQGRVRLRVTVNGCCSCLLSLPFLLNPLPVTGLPSNRSDREVRVAGLALQTVWGYKDLRRTLEKDGWKKTDFMVNLNAPSNTRANGGYEDSTLPLINNGRDRTERAYILYKNM